jgi:lipoate-protein ligase A
MNFDFENLSNLFYTKAESSSFAEVESVRESMEKSEVLKVLKEAYLSDDREAILKYASQYLDTQGIKPIKGQ